MNKYTCFFYCCLMISAMGLVGGSLLGCEASARVAGTRDVVSDPSSDAGSDTDTDVDSDADSDTDSDTDSDGDSDGDSDENVCTPGELWCVGNWTAVCAENGITWEKQEDCSPQGLVCAAGECVDISQECATSINAHSYIGCEYWAVTLANPAIEDLFTFALVIANDGDADAQVNVTDGPNGAVDNDYTVPSGEMIIVEDLPWKEALKFAGYESGSYATRKVTSGAYRITSTIPVTAYQFNALDYHLGGEYSYTNDASLLLPAHVYRSEYVVVGRSTHHLRSYPLSNEYEYSSDPGFVAIVGRDKDTVSVSIETRAHTLASDSVSNTSIPAASPGDTIEVEIAPFEVLQLLSGNPGETCPNMAYCGQSWPEGSLTNYDCCDIGPDYDLTGTVIQVTGGKNPAVYAGSAMTFVPFDVFASDHLEQQMFPLETWGLEYLCVHTGAQDSGQPSVWRVVSGADDNQISFEPSSVHPTTILNKGEFIEFESLADFRVLGSNRVAVAQFMVGQNYENTDNDDGDPAMTMTVPVEQYRTNYIFLAPDSYEENYISVIHEIGDYPLLDGIPIAGVTVEISDEYARTNLEISSGIHHIEAESQFGINVYGIGAYTSYMYPGGLDLKKVEVPVV